MVQRWDGEVVGVVGSGCVTGDNAVSNGGWVLSLSFGFVV